jgi:predicted RND superfamily exporter protein
VSFLAEVPGATPLAPTGDELAAAYAVAPPDLARSVVSDDGQDANLIFRVGPGTLEDLRDAIDEVNTDLDPLLADRPRVDMTPSGLAVVGTGLLENLEANRTLLTYVSIGLAAGWLLLRLRGLGRMILAMVPVLLAVGASSVVVGLAGITLSPMTTLSGPLIVAACAEFSVLILMRYLEERRNGFEPQEATDRASARTGRAFVVSALTTIGGFAVLIFSALPLLSDFGKVVTLNVVVALSSALIAVPPMLVWFDRRGWLKSDIMPTIDEVSGESDLVEGSSVRAHG